MPINVVVVSGTVHKLFEERETNAGLKNRSLLINLKENDKDRRIYVNAFGTVVESMDELEEGGAILVQGRLTEQAWQKDEEWHHRVEIVASKIEDLGELDGPPDE